METLKGYLEIVLIQIEGMDLWDMLFVWAICNILFGRAITLIVILALLYTLHRYACVDVMSKLAAMLTIFQCIILIF